MATERWTDEMLDELASTVGEMRESINEVKDSVDGLRVTAQALLQVAAQTQRRMDMFDEEIGLMKQQQQRHAEEMELMKQRQTESDQRFNVLLEEVRFLIRGKEDE